MQYRQLEPGIDHACAEGAWQNHRTTCGVGKWMALAVVANHQEFIGLNGIPVNFAAAGSIRSEIACYQGTEQPPWAEKPA